MADGLIHVQAVLDCEPPTATHHRKKIVRRKSGAMGMADSDELSAARDRITVALMASGKRPRRPLAGPILAGFGFYFGGAEAHGYHTDKPDDDNLQKTLMDCLADAGWIKDDKTVCVKFVHKNRCQGPGRIEVLLYEADPARPLTMRLDLLAGGTLLHSWEIAPGEPWGATP